MISIALFFTSIGGVKLMRDTMGKRRDNKEANRIKSVNTQLEIVNEILAIAEVGINEVTGQDIARFRRALEIIENTEERITSLSSESRVSRTCREKYEELINAKFLSKHREMRNELKTLTPDSLSDNLLAFFDERLEELTNLATSDFNRNSLEELTHLVNKHKDYFKILLELYSLLSKLESGDVSVISDIEQSFNILQQIIAEISNQEFNNHFNDLTGRYAEALAEISATVSSSLLKDDGENLDPEFDPSEDGNAYEDHSPLSFSQFTYPESTSNQGRSSISLSPLDIDELQQIIEEFGSGSESEEDDNLIQFAESLLTQGALATRNHSLEPFAFANHPAETMERILSRQNDSAVNTLLNEEFDDDFLLVHQDPTLEPALNIEASYSSGFIGTAK